MKRLGRFLGNQIGFRYTYLSGNSKAPGDLVINKFQHIRPLGSNVYIVHMSSPGLETKRKFFITDSFTFRNLQEILSIEFPTKDVHFESSKPLNINSQIIETIRDSPTEVEISYKIDEFVVKLNNRLRKDFADADLSIGKDPLSFMNLQMAFNKGGLSVSNARVAAKFCQEFASQMKMEEAKGNLDESKIQEAMCSALRLFGENYSKGKEKVIDRINELESELAKLRSQTGLIEEMLTGRLVLYLYLLIFISAVQMVSFYYMIFHVEWLGWDIIEPITYSVTQITLLLGLRYMWKYRRNREFDSLKSIYLQKQFKKNHEMAKLYNYSKKREAELQTKLESQNTLLKILKNRRNYYKSLETY